MLRAVLFDLDDTLYPEWDFVRGGFRAVARQITSENNASPPQVMELLERLHRESRDRVFDRAAEQLRFPLERVPELVEVFRSHPPSLSLEQSARAVLQELRSRYRLGCVTDGFARVQRRKIASLGLEELLDAVVVADELGGRSAWKPSSRPFVHCCRLLEVEVAAAVFVGDHPERDIAGARNAGLEAIRIRRSGAYFKDAEATVQPSAVIDSLADLPSLLSRLEGELE